MKVGRFANAVVLGVSAVWISSASPSSAVIVAGTLGTGNNNSTRAGLDAFLASDSRPAFPYWDNLVRVADASGVYLGYDASTMRGWVLSANHVTVPAAITVAGNAYTVTGGMRIGSSDLKLYEIGGESDPAPPALPTVPLAGMAATTGEFTVMTGRGYTTSTTSPYAWATPGYSDANGMRWATNTVEGNAIVNIGTTSSPNLQPYVVVDFDAAGDFGVTPYDGQASLGDSGGGMFIYRNGQWELSGITHFVIDGTGDEETNPSEPGDQTAYSDVFAKAAAIDAVTGTLVPEPSASALLAGGFFLLILCARGTRH